MTQPEPLQWFAIVNPHPGEMPDQDDCGRVGWLARTLTTADDPDLKVRQYVIRFEDGTEGTFTRDELQRIYTS